MAAASRPLALPFRLPDPKPIPPKPVLLPTPPAVETSEEVRKLRAGLTASVAAKVLSATELVRALAKERREESVPTTLAPLDSLLGGGLPRGKMVEIAGPAARFSIVLATLASATSMGEAAVLIDLGDHFDPQLAEADGVDLRRLLWVRPKTMKEAVLSVEKVAAAGFQLVVLDAGTPPLRGRRVGDAAWVRLARTAEAHGAVMLISTPYPLTGTASEAMVRTSRTRARWLGGKNGAPRLLAGTAVALTLEKHRHMRAGRGETLILHAADGIQ